MKAKVVGPRDGVAGFMGSIGVRFMLDGRTPNVTASVGGSIAQALARG